MLLFNQSKEEFYSLTLHLDNIPQDSSGMEDIILLRKLAEGKVSAVSKEGRRCRIETFKVHKDEGYINFISGTMMDYNDPNNTKDEALLNVIIEWMYIPESYNFVISLNKKTGLKASHVRNFLQSAFNKILEDDMEVYVGEEEKQKEFA